MNGALFVALLVTGGLVALAVWGTRGLLRRQARQRLLEQPFPAAWGEILEQNVPLVQRLGPDRRRRLERLIQAFVADIPFEGAGGLAITDEMRVTIAAQACLLVLHSQHRNFPILRTIVVYPGHSYSDEGRLAYRGDGIFSETSATLLGESWGDGSVVLAWDAVLHGARSATDGHNVTLHELAHQLDQENGAANGIPTLDGGLKHAPWAQVLERDFRDLVKKTHRGQPGAIDPYGATNEAEFFAVATEVFFENPERLRRGYPEMFGLLIQFYGFDPETWRPNPPS